MECSTWVFSCHFYLEFSFMDWQPQHFLLLSRIQFKVALGYILMISFLFYNTTPKLARKILIFNFYWQIFKLYHAPSNFGGEYSTWRKISIVVLQLRLLPMPKIHRCKCLPSAFLKQCFAVNVTSSPTKRDHFENSINHQRQTWWIGTYNCFPDVSFSTLHNSSAINANYRSTKKKKNYFHHLGNINSSPICHDQGIIYCDSEYISLASEFMRQRKYSWYWFYCLNVTLFQERFICW